MLLEHQLQGESQGLQRCSQSVTEEELTVVCLEDLQFWGRILLVLGTLECSSLFLLEELNKQDVAGIETGVLRHRSAVSHLISSSAYSGINEADFPWIWVSSQSLQALVAFCPGP